MAELNYGIRIVIFDLGGVLLRTQNPQPRQNLAGRYGISREELEKLVFASEESAQAERGTLPPDAVWQHAQKVLRVANEDMDQFRDEFWAGDCLDQNLLALIGSLRVSYRTVLLSNAWSDIRKTLARRFGKLDVFDMIVFSAEVGLRKPDAEIYRYVLDLLGADAEEAVFVDDFTENIQAAHKMGMHTIQFKSASQTRKDLSNLLGLDAA